MANEVREQVDCFVRGLVKRNLGEHEFHQAGREVAETVMPTINDHPEYRDAQILERMTVT